MRVQKALILTVLALFGIAMLALAASPAQGAVTNESRLDVGPDLEVRVNEPFPVTPDVFDDVQAGVEIREVWWDTNDREDTNPDGNPTNDMDVFNRTFQHDGLATVGTWVFTLWVNFTDDKLVNASLEIMVVENKPPVITAGSNPSGTVGEPISFTVVVTDIDSPEVSLKFAWDFDVNEDADGDGQPDNDEQSTAKTNVHYTYTSEGTYSAVLRVTDDYGAQDIAYITITVNKPPGITQRTVEVEGGYKLDNVSIQKGGWVTYHFVAQPGRLYQVDIEVSNGQDVYVMVQRGKEQFQQYEGRTSQTAYQAEWSEVNNPSTHISIQFKPDVADDIYVTVDNGHLFDLPGAKAAVTSVTVQDIDRNNILAQIPSVVWIAMALVAVVVVALFVIRFYFESSEARKARQAKEQMDTQEKVSARGELAALLENPDEVVRQKYAPKPAPEPAPAATPPPGPVARPAPGPAPGPAHPPSSSPAPAPQAGPQPGPQAGPQPGPQPPKTGPQPAEPAASACKQCGSPAEAGWQVCPSCGANL